MNLLDENIPESQRLLLMSWHIRVRQIGHDIGHQGMEDREQIVPLLLSLNRPVLFTRDLGLYDRQLSHDRYGIVCLAVEDIQSALYIRRIMHHPAFSTKKKRLSRIARVGPSGIHFWQRNQQREMSIAWKN